jgi:tricorn protease
MPAGGGAPKQLTFYPAPRVRSRTAGATTIRSTAGPPTASPILFRSLRDGFTHRTRGSTRCPWPAAPPRCPCRCPAPVIFARRHPQSCTRRCGGTFAAKSATRAAGPTICTSSISAHPSLVQVTDDPRTDRDPMWIGGAIYFNSDRSGVFNLYRYDIATRQTRKLTHYKRLGRALAERRRRRPDRLRIGRRAACLRHARRSDRALPIEVPADDTSRRPQAVNAADDIESHRDQPGRRARRGRGARRRLHVPVGTASRAI